MRSLAWALLLSVCFVTTAGREPARRVIEVSTADELMAAFREPLENVTVQLAPGEYVVTARKQMESAASCYESIERLPTTLGLVVSGQNIRICGSKQGEAVVISDADYRVYFLDCVDCELERVTITGDVMVDGTHVNPVGVAIRGSTVRVAECVIRDDASEIADSSSNVPIGIRVQASRVTLEFNEITSARAGIHLLDDADAAISNNLIEGESRCGTGVVASCDSRAKIERNLLRGLTDGVMVFGSEIACVANIIESVKHVAIFVGARETRLLLKKNAIYQCDSSGIYLNGNDAQSISQNLIVSTGLRVAGRPTIRVDDEGTTVPNKNTLYDNQSLGTGEANVAREMFWRARRQWTRTYRNTPVGVDGRHRFHESAFLARYGRWMD